MRLFTGATPPDPLFAALRRRHPDVDLVLLPPERPAPAHRDPTGDAAEVDARLAVVEVARDRVLAALVPLVPDCAAAGPVAPSFGETEAHVRALVRLRGTGLGQTDLVDQVATALRDGGWAVGVVAGPREVGRVLAVLDDVELTLTHADGSGAVLVTLAGPALAVGVEEARRLVAGAR